MKFSPYKTIILEDDLVANILLENFCENHPDLQYIGNFESVQDAAAFLKNNPVDLVFLDIELKNSSGFDLLKHLDPDTLVVVTSVNPDYFKTAQEKGIPFFLNKPISLQNFLEIVSVIKNKLTTAPITSVK